MLSFSNHNNDNKPIAKITTKTTTYEYCNYWLQLCVLGLQLLPSALESWALAPSSEASALRSGASALTIEVGDRRSDIEQDGSFSSHLSV